MKHGLPKFLIFRMRVQQSLHLIHTRLCATISHVRMSATCAQVTPSLSSGNPNASRMDERPIELTRTDGNMTQTNGHDDNPALDCTETWTYISLLDMRRMPLIWTNCQSCSLLKESYFQISQHRHIKAFSVVDLI